MPRQFTPADRETVKERVEDMDSVHQVRSCGEGLYVMHVAGDSSVRVFTDMMETVGWFVTSYEPAPDGDKVTLAPVSEVPS